MARPVVADDVAAIRADEGAELGDRRVHRCRGSGGGDAEEAGEEPIEELFERDGALVDHLVPLVVAVVTAARPSHHVRLATIRENGHSGGACLAGTEERVSIPLTLVRAPDR